MTAIPDSNIVVVIHAHLTEDVIQRAKRAGEPVRIDVSPDAVLHARETGRPITVS